MSRQGRPKGEFGPKRDGAEGNTATRAPHAPANKMQLEAPWH